MARCCSICLGVYLEERPISTGERSRHASRCIAHQARVCTGEPHRGCVRAVIESVAENRTQFLSDRDDPQGTVICQEAEQISVTSTLVRGSIDPSASAAAENRSENRTSSLSVTSIDQLSTVEGVNGVQTTSMPSSASLLVSVSLGTQVAAETAACSNF